MPCLLPLTHERSGSDSAGSSSQQSTKQIDQSNQYLPTRFNMYRTDLPDLPDLPDSAISLPLPSVLPGRMHPKRAPSAQQQPEAEPEFGLPHRYEARYGTET